MNYLQRLVRPPQVIDPNMSEGEKLKYFGICGYDRNLKFLKHLAGQNLYDKCADGGSCGCNGNCGCGGSGGGCCGNGQCGGTCGCNGACNF